MANRIFLSALLLSLSLAAQAEGGLLGSWKIVGSECDSGAAQRGNFIPVISGQVVITENTIDSKVRVEMKIDKVDSNRLLRDYEDELAQANAQPAGPGKQKAISDIETEMRLAQSLGNGVVCQVSESESYRIDGALMRTSRINASSDCEDLLGNTHKDGASRFVLAGDVLRLSPAQPSEEDFPCPKGDRPVTILNRAR
jgi:hypothetical protein